MLYLPKAHLSGMDASIVRHLKRGGEQYILRHLTQQLLTLVTSVASLTRQLTCPVFIAVGIIKTLICEAVTCFIGCKTRQQSIAATVA